MADMSCHNTRHCPMASRGLAGQRKRGISPVRIEDHDIDDTRLAFNQILEDTASMNAGRVLRLND